MTNALFSDQENELDPNTDYAAELIGEGKRYKDASAVAKAKLEADAFIERLKAENAEMRASLKGEAKINEFLDKLKSVNVPAGGNTNSNENNSSESATNQQNTNNNPKSLSTDDIVKLLDEREGKRKEEQNLAYAAQKAKEAFGANATAVLTAKAAELGMTHEELTDLARKKPMAFLKLVEANAPANGVSSPKSTVNTAALRDTNGNTKNNTYYVKLRKQIGDAEFFKPAIQNEMFKMAQQLGEDFYN